METFGIAIADAAGIAAAAGGLRQSTLNHGFSGLEELPDEPLLLTHHLILR